MATKTQVPTQPKSARAGTGTAPAEAPQTRLNVNINSQTAAALKDYADKHGVSVTEAVRRLVGVGDFIAKSQDEGKQVLFRQDGETERVVFTY
jgi:hypothetical protein